MSKTITIPSDRGSVVIVSVNGRDYSYKAGTTVTVPDEVAALLDSNEQEAVRHGRIPRAPLNTDDVYNGEDFIPVYATPDGQLVVRKEDMAAIASELIAQIPAELPEVDAEDNGKVLTVVEGAWAAAALPTGE